MVSFVPLAAAIMPISSFQVIRFSCSNKNDKFYIDPNNKHGGLRTSFQTEHHTEIQNAFIALDLILEKMLEGVVDVSLRRCSPD